MKETIGERVRLARQTSGMTQKELSEKCGFTVYTKISKIEADSQVITLTDALKICDALGLDLLWLASGHGTSVPPDAGQAYKEGFRDGFELRGQIVYAALRKSPPIEWVDTRAR